MVNINERSVMRPGHLCASGSAEAENNCLREIKEKTAFLAGQDAGKIAMGILNDPSRY